MSRLVNLRLLQRKLMVNRFVPVRNSSHSHDDTPNPAFFGNYGPGIHSVKLEPFDPQDPSHGVADLPDNFRGLPVQQNIGPPITMDYIPIPYKSYKEVIAEMDRKFNMALLLNVVALVFATYLSLEYDIMGYAEWCNPESYRNRKKINAKLDAEAAAAAKENVGE